MDLMHLDGMFVNLPDEIVVVDPFAETSVVGSIDFDKVDVDLPLAVLFVDYKLPCCFFVRTDCIHLIHSTDYNHWLD
jgi:hypothetical protein